MKPRLEVRDPKPPTARNFTLGQWKSHLPGRTCVQVLGNGKQRANERRPGSDKCRQHDKRR